MKKYKLTIEKDGALLMGAALLQYMTEKGFTVPAKFELVYVENPFDKPVKPGSGATSADWKVYRNYNNNVYQPARRDVDAQNAILKRDYHKQFPDFAAYLKTIFVIATGTWNRTTRKWDYVLEGNDCAYSFQQCADKLLGKYTKGTQLANPIEFIADQNF